MYGRGGRDYVWQLVFFILVCEPLFVLFGTRSKRTIFVGIGSHIAADFVVGHSLNFY